MARRARRACREYVEYHLDIQLDEAMNQERWQRYYPIAGVSFRARLFGVVQLMGVGNIVHTTTLYLGGGKNKFTILAS